MNNALDVQYSCGLGGSIFKTHLGREFICLMCVCKIGIKCGY